MGGPKNVGKVKDGSTSGSLFPDCPNINFAVRSNKTLSSFNIGEFDIPSKIEPSIIDPILDTLGKCNENIFILCDDAKNVFILCDDTKKVTAGVDGTDGDVDMFGFESGMPLTQKKSIHEVRY